MSVICFSGPLADTEKAKRRFVIPGTEGHPGYGFKAWMKGYASAGASASVAALALPLMAAA